MDCNLLAALWYLCSTTKANSITRVPTHKGNFSLKAPVGNRNLQIQIGGGSNFRTTVPVSVSEGQTTAVNPSTTRLDQVAHMAFVAGSYDSIQTIVTGLGYEITEITNADLADYNIVSQYDVIFLNCGAKQNLSNQSAIDTNLANFVTNGGSIYASDWAVAYLTGGLTNSHVCSEAGGFIPDDKLCAINDGAEGVINGSQITDTDLASALGLSTIDIQYDLGIWEQISTYDPAFWQVMVKNPVTNAPLMIKTNNFSGGTAGSPVGRTAEDENWITICHHDSEGATFTITIPEADWPAYEANGDSIGECSNSNNSGTIFYTTFHNHAGNNIVNTTPILQYVILNL